MAVELADAEAAADLRTYLERARRFDPEGAARLQSTPTALAVWTCARPGSGLLGEGVVLGLRVLPLADAPAAPVDECHPIGALLDRLARPENGTRLPMPPAPVSPPWAAITPPRGGWTLEGAARLGALGDDITGAVRALGFAAADDEVVLASAGVWHRVSTRTGHVLTR